MAVLSSIFEIDNEIYLDQSYLKYNFKISEQAIQTLINKNKSNSKLVKQNPKTKRKFIISYSLIFEEFSSTFNIQPKYKFLNKLKKAKKELRTRKKVQDKYEAENYIRFILSYYWKDWKGERLKYKSGLVEPGYIEDYCRNHRLLAGAIRLRDEGISLKDIFEVYIKYRNLIFNPKCYQSFVYKLSKIKNEEDIADSLLHKLRNRFSNNRKLKDDVIVEIYKNFLNPKKLNAGQILEEVNKYLVRKNRKTISRSTVEAVIASRYVKNEYMIFRHGVDYTREHLLPYFHFNKPTSNGIMWAIDGSRLQFMYKDDKNYYNFLSFFVIFDTYSSKILGYSFGESENTKMVIDAIRMACDNTKYLPTEVVHDNSSVFKSFRFQELVMHTKVIYVNWRAIKVGNSRDNGYVERFFGVFQESVCKKCDGYLGDGIRSKNLNGKPSPEEIKKYSSKTKIRTLEQLKEQVSNLIDEYNNKKNREGKSPNSMSKENISEHVIPIETVLYSKMFWLKKEITVRNSCITITNFNKTYRYNIYELESIGYFGQY